MNVNDYTPQFSDASTSFLWPLGGQFLLDPNEINGWGIQGPIDHSNTQDLGNVGAANLSRLSGGLCFPFAVRIEHFFAWHSNSAANAQAWGWVLAKQQKTAGSNTVTTTYILDEVADNGGTGPRNYGNNQNQQTDISPSALLRMLFPRITFSYSQSPPPPR